MWGGEDGWSAQRSNGTLPVYWAAGLVLADLNHDGWEDIVTLNSAIDVEGRKVTVNKM